MNISNNLVIGLAGLQFSSSNSRPVFTISEQNFYRSYVTDLTTYSGAVSSGDEKKKKKNLTLFYSLQLFKKTALGTI